MKFMDRWDAGKILASELKDYANRTDVIVLGLPRGGVPVAYEIAKSLSAPLDVFIVRKLGIPGYEELAMGAIAMGGMVVFNQNILKELRISKDRIDSVIKAEEDELQRRQFAYRGTRAFPMLRDKIVILVDDGIATGATMRVAIQALRQFKPKILIAAVPVAAIESCQEMDSLVDKLICPLKPEVFNAVGEWYDNFSQTSDAEVCQLLQENALTYKPN